MKNKTVKATVTFKTSEANHKELLESFNRAVKMWSIVKGVSITT